MRMTLGIVCALHIQGLAQVVCVIRHQQNNTHAHTPRHRETKNKGREKERERKSTWREKTAYPSEKEPTSLFPYKQPGGDVKP